MRICIPIRAQTHSQAVEKIRRANPLADLLEFRLDLLDSGRLKELVREAARPVVATYRSRQQGGWGADDYETRRQRLRTALEAGVDFVDAEYGPDFPNRSGLLETLGAARIILSTHLLQDTPSQEALRIFLKGMAATGARLIKIVSRARAVEDNLRMLALIPEARQMGLEIIAFCLGPLGRLSRIACPLLGGYLTFASLEAGEESAEGQIPAREMRKMLDLLSRNTY